MALYLRQFVRLFTWDHWQEGWEEDLPTDEPLDRVGPGLRVCPFEVRGQIVKIDKGHVWVEGAWIWLESGEVNFGTFGIVRGAIRRSLPLEPGTPL